MDTNTGERLSYEQIIPGKLMAIRSNGQRVPANINRASSIVSVTEAEYDSLKKMNRAQRRQWARNHEN